MFIKLILLALSILASSSVWAETTVRSAEKFDAWEVTISIDDFEGEVKPSLATDILSPNGTKIGKFYIGYFITTNGNFSNAFVSMNIRGLDGTWPECDYEFTKYKIDSSTSTYFPTIGYACPSLVFNSDMVSKFKRGNSFKFSASGTTGFVNLKGFTKAWNYSNAKLNRS